MLTGARAFADVRGRVGNPPQVANLPHIVRLVMVCGLVLILAAGGMCATRPRYGGVMRVEIRQAIESADPPSLGRGIPDLAGGFTITRWEAGRRAVFEANEGAAGGRPFVDGVEVTMGRALRDQSIDLELGRADLVELGPAEMRRQAARR